MKKLTGQIFMGAGEHSGAMIEHLRSKLDEALETLGGIQQPPTCWDPPEVCNQHMEDVKTGQAEIEEIAREIFLGLTGKTVESTKAVEQ
jgi:hypothetical protein